MIESTTRLQRLLPRIVIPGDGPQIELVPGHLAVALYIDGVAGERLVTDDDLDRWDMEVEDLLPIALENLRRRCADDGWHPVEAAPGLRIYMAKDGAASARMLLLDELLQPSPLGGTLVAVPGPDQLLAVPLNDMDDLETMRVLATAAAMASQNTYGNETLSDQIFWWDGDSWHLLAVERNTEEIRVHPTGAFLQAIERLAAMNFYGTAAEA